MTRIVVAVCLVALSWTLTAASAAAQAVRATVLGTVSDRTGAVLPGATVTVTNTDTRVAQTTVSDSQGHYTLTNLLPGPYDIEAALPGFQTIVRNGVRLVVGSESVVDFTLGVSSVQETVTVTADAPVVETVSVALGTVIEQKQISELPLIDRSYSKLIALAPGANEVPPATAGGQFQQFFGRQPQYTVSGARPEGQVFLLDNTNVQNYWNRGSGSGQLGTTLGVEAIAEYQILTNTYINRYRKQSSEPRVDSLDDSEELSLYRYLDNEAASRGGSVEAQVLDRFAEQDIKTAIEALPPQYRITVLLADVEGFSYNDIAEITNVKKGTVMSRLFRGRRLLQKALVDQARSAGFAGGKQS